MGQRGFSNTPDTVERNQPGPAFRQKKVFKFGLGLIPSKQVLIRQVIEPLPAGIRIGRG
jgi:hypothetical protein